MVELQLRPVYIQQLLLRHVPTTAASYGRLFRWMEGDD